MDITIVCVPYQGDVARWGCALGPQAFLERGLSQRLEALGHRVHTPVWIELPRSERTRDTVTNIGYLASRAAEAVKTALQQPDSLVVMLEGDCTHALGPIGGMAQVAGTPGVVWFDAHGDLNTRATTTSGFWGGMPYAVALGWDLDDWRLAAGLEPPLRPEAAALIGTSDLDPAEEDALQRHPILHLRAEALLGADAAERVQRALRPRAGEAASWYLHMDLDVAGPEESPGGMTPAPSWAPREQLIEAARAAARAVPVRVFSLAVYNPAADSAGRGVRFGLDLASAIMEGLQ
ncbi:MAG TPA: arginase family protein [Ktedonobacterales bacterium]|jgi:arginase